MSLGLLGKKVGMTRVFDETEGKMIPVTVIAAENNEFLQVKTTEKDGYNAVQVAFDEQKEFRLNKAKAGHIKTHGGTAKKLIKEFRFEDGEEVPSFEDITAGVTLFEVGQTIDVIGKTKGKGFQGVVKRYNFGGLPQSHGSMMHRRTGAVGAGSWPARIWKGQKMPGRHGNYRRTVQNLKVVQVREEEGVILVSGAVPGSKGSYVVVRPAIKGQ